MKEKNNDDYFEKQNPSTLRSIGGLLTFSTILPLNIYTTIDEMAKLTWFWPIINGFIGLIAAIIAFGATLLVDNGTIIAQKIGVPDSVIALTVVALGTSLPELVTAITSLIKGHGSLSLGNIIGANLFNLVLVSGLAITIRPFSVPSEKMFLQPMTENILL